MTMQKGNMIQGYSHSGDSKKSKVINKIAYGMTAKILRKYDTPIKCPQFLHLALKAGPKNARRRVEIPGCWQWGHRCMVYFAEQ
jgi:hypothetical protein